MIRRPRRQHPAMFIMALGTGVAALLEGDLGVLAVCVGLVVWTLS
jgi:hypothetical protein